MALNASYTVRFRKDKAPDDLVKALNRIGATQLFEVSRVLDVPVSFFFENAGALSFRSRARKTVSPMDDRETLHLVRDFFGIRDRRVRLSVARMVKAIAQSSVSRA